MFNRRTYRKQKAFLKFKWTGNVYMQNVPLAEHQIMMMVLLDLCTSLMVKSKQRIGINCGREFRVLIGYDLKSFDENEVNDVNRIHRHEDRGLICCDQTSFDIEERGPEVFIFSSTPSDIANEAFELRVQRHLERFHLL
ncbi:hypothetical protein Tco_0551929 [Tanacetum coccineum]